MDLYAKLKANRDRVLALAERWGARNVRVFGSAARGEADEQSDLDLLVDLDPDRSLLDLAGFLLDVQELLGGPVDVVTERGLKARIRDRVLQEAVALLNGSGEKRYGALVFGDVWPLPKARLLEAASGAKAVLNVEQNYTGQLAGLIREETGLEMDASILRFDGRQMSGEEIAQRVKKEGF